MKSIRVGICVLVGFSVLAFGGVEPWGLAVLEIGAATLFVLWGALAIWRRHAEIHWNWLYLPFLGLAGIALAQRALGLTAYAYPTKIELLKGGAYLLIFFLGAESFRTPEQLKSLAWFLIDFGFVVSLFSIIQFFTSNGKLYWIVMLEQGGDIFGPYVNRDHFAGFDELIVPLGLSILFHGAVRQEKFMLLSLLTIVPIGALALSGSRGGIVSVVVEIVLLVFFMRNSNFAKKQLLTATFFALALCVMLVWLGIGPTLERFEVPTTGHLSQEGRVWMYGDTWQIFLHHPWLGTGLGTLQTVFPRYESHYQGGIVEHAHNDFLEMLSDTGVAGGLCGVAFVLLLFWRGSSNLRLAERRWERGLRAGALTGCAGLLVHGLFDFNLHIPSNALIFVLLTVMATSSTEEGASGRHEKRLVPAPVEIRECE